MEFKVIRDYILIIFIVALSIFTVEYSEKEKELIEAKSIAVEFYDKYEDSLVAIEALNQYADELEDNSLLLKELHRITK